MRCLPAASDVDVGTFLRTASRRRGQCRDYRR
jgi:hypothetical protein